MITALLCIIVVLLLAIGVRIDAIACAVVEAVAMAKRQEAAELAAIEQAAIDAKIRALAGRSRDEDRKAVAHA